MLRPMILVKFTKNDLHKSDDYLGRIIFLPQKRNIEGVIVCQGPQNFPYQ